MKEEIDQPIKVNWFRRIVYAFLGSFTGLLACFFVVGSLLMLLDRIGLLPHSPTLIVILFVILSTPVFLIIFRRVYKIGMRLADVHDFHPWWEESWSKKMSLASIEERLLRYGLLNLAVGLLLIFVHRYWNTTTTMYYVGAVFSLVVAGIGLIELVVRWFLLRIEKEVLPSAMLLDGLRHSLLLLTYAGTIFFILTALILAVSHNGFLLIAGAAYYLTFILRIKAEVIQYLAKREAITHNPV